MPTTQCSVTYTSKLSIFPSTHKSHKSLTKHHVDLLTKRTQQNDKIHGYYFASTSAYSSFQWLAICFVVASHTKNSIFINSSQTQAVIPISWQSWQQKRRQCDTLLMSLLRFSSHILWLSKLLQVSAEPLFSLELSAFCLHKRGVGGKMLLQWRTLSPSSQQSALLISKHN